MKPITDAIVGVADSVVSAAADLLSEWIEDKDERNRLAHELTTMGAKHAHAETLAQISVNKQEAAHGSTFVAGWRPATGWVCVSAMAMNFVLIPLVGPVFDAYTKVDLVPSDLSIAMPILLGLLGLGRTAEKFKGVAREAIIARGVQQ